MNVLQIVRMQETRHSITMKLCVDVQQPKLKYVLHNRNELTTDAASTRLAQLTDTVYYRIIFLQK